MTRCKRTLTKPTTCMPIPLRTYRLHYLDGRVEFREAFAYSEAGPYIIFHRIEDQSDLDSWEERSMLLMMVEDDETPVPEGPPSSIPGLPAGRLRKG